MANLIHRLRADARANAFIAGLLRGMRGLARWVESSLIARWIPFGRFEVHKGGLRFELEADAPYPLYHTLAWEPERWEDAEFRLALALARHSQAVLDIGANVGVYSVGMALANPAAQVWAIEPLPANLKALRRHLELNACQRVQVLPVAVGEASGVLPLEVPTDEAPSDVVSAVAGFHAAFRPLVALRRIEVALQTLDQLAAEHQWPAIDLIKLDVEFYELEVLRGAQELIRRDRPVVLIELHHPTRFDDAPTLQQVTPARRSAEIVAYLHAAGYTGYLIGEHGLYPLEQLPVPEHHNYLFAPGPAPAACVTLESAHRLLPRATQG